MAGCCHDDYCSSPKELNSPHWRLGLWIALVINASMFLTEVVAGVAAGSASLQADAIDFLGDAANYVISLGVAGMALSWRARTALLKGWSLGLLGLAVLFSTAWRTAPLEAQLLTPLVIRHPWLFGILRATARKQWS
jgi:Co/Zn/Cd efflux system component